MDLPGVLPAALSQPQIHFLVRTSPGTSPLVDANSGSFDETAYLDTGTSEVLLSQETAGGLGLSAAGYNGRTIGFNDTGVAGAARFNVSDPVYVSLASYTPSLDTSVASAFNTVGRAAAAGIESRRRGRFDRADRSGRHAGDAGEGGVIDPKPANAADLTSLGDVNAYLYNPGTPYRPATAGSDPGIPATNFHVQMSYADFSPFTSVTPAGRRGRRRRPTRSSGRTPWPSPAGPGRHAAGVDLVRRRQRHRQLSVRHRGRPRRSSRRRWRLRSTSTIRRGRTTPTTPSSWTTPGTRCRTSSSSPSAAWVAGGGQRRRLLPRHAGASHARGGADPLRQRARAGVRRHRHQPRDG